MISIADYRPSPTARLTDKERARVKFAWGPLGSGKTSWLCWRVYRKALEAAKAGVGLRAVLVRDTYRNLEDTTLKTWLEWFPDGMAGTLKSRQSVKDFILKIRLGHDKPWTYHEVLFRHGQTAADASSFLSSEYGFIGLEEVAPAFTPSGVISPGIAEEVFDVATMRLRQRGIEHPELCLTANPPPTFHWSYKRLLQLGKEDLARRNFQTYYLAAKDNEHNLRPGYYDELRASLRDKETLIKRFVDGEIVAVYPGLPVFQKEFSPALHVKDNLNPVAGLPITLLVDSSGLAPAALFTQIDHKGRWLWLKEIQGGYVDGKLAEQVGAKRFAQICKMEFAQNFQGFSLATGYGDPYRLTAKSDTDEKSWKEYFESEGFELEPGVQTITDRIEGIKDRLTTMIEGHPALLIKKSGCPLSIEALAGGYRYGLDPNASRVMGAEPIKDIFSHVIDAAGHGARKLFPLVMPTARKKPYMPTMAPSAMSA